MAYRIATCLEEELEDVEAIRTVAAQLQIPRKQTGRKDFCFLVANITTHRREIHTWINQQEGDAFALQETHLLPHPMKEALINYDRGKWSTTGIPAHDTGKGTSGGLMLGAKTHVNMREGPRFAVQGKGFLFGIFRFPGYDIAVGTVYLESGVGPDSGLNPAILSELIAVIKTFACCWVLAGDWNCSWEDLQKSAFPRLVRAGVLVPEEATTTHGSTLDYALCSRELVGLLDATVIWDVPFRPHAGVMYNLRVSGLGTPILQPKVFTRECLQLPRNMPRPPDPGRISFLLEETSLHPRDTAWGGFVRWLETTTCEDGEQGRAWRVEAEFKPLVKSTSPEYPWLGRKQGFWGRLALWVSQAAKNKLHTRVIPVVLKHLRQEDKDLDLEGVDVQALRACLFSTIQEGKVPSHSILEDLNKVAKEAARQHHDLQSQQYQEWLSNATMGGMKGLYAVLRKAEATTTRPYRDLPLEIRPHARRAAWMHLWQPTTSVKLASEDAFITLRRQAISQYQEVGPVQPLELARVIKKLAPKAPGLDGLTANMLKQASQPQLHELADHIAAWESSGRMPGQVLTTGVAMLPKKPERERPIGLTSFGYRLWARSRWPLYETWAGQYALSAPWDGAKKGMASLDIALTRLVRGEIRHHLKKQGATLLLDLREFYEHVGLLQLVEQAQQQSFPPLILHHCLALYTHSRYICTEETLSPPVQPTRGIIAGCPYAPGLSKLVMHPVMAELWSNPNLDHCDLYIDDSSFDIEGSSTTEVMHKALKVWRNVKQAFQAQHLPISVGKSAWVCSSRAMEKKLAEHLGPDDPKIQSCWRDLGIDSAGGKRRRVTIHKQRFSKAANRSKKLTQLKVQGPARGKAAKAGLESAAAYGHQAVGLAPKRMKFMRQLAAIHNGRFTNGSIEVVLDLRGTLKPDPSALLVEQHLRSYVSLVSRWPEDLEPVLVSVFQGMQERFSDHREPWRIAAGPLGATLCYAKDMGWTALSLTQWRIEGELWSLDDPVQLEQVVKRIHGHWAIKRRQAIAGLEASSELASGVDWTVGKKLLKKLPGLQAKALQSVWQGSLRCGPKAWCSLCDQPASQEHLLWDCKWWLDNHPVPPAVRTALERLPSCVKVRGLPPVLEPAVKPRKVKLTGLWQQKAQLEDPELRYATDGSPGSSGDPRCWQMTWAAIAFTCKNGSPEILATATGPVPGEQTVFRAEAMALLFIAEHTSGVVDVTMDARSVKTRVERRTLGKSSLDLFIPLREHSDRLQLTWIRSHRSLDQHRQEFGVGTEWRWSANGAVGKLAGDEANGARDLSREAQLQTKDKETHKVQSFLAERVALIFGYDKDQGPQVAFEGESAPSSKKTRASGLSRKQRSSQTQAPPTQPQPGGAAAPNKRDLLRVVVNDPPLGHQWVWTSQHQSGARIKCTRCQLGVQQIDKREKIERLLSQPCVGFGDSAIFSRYWQCHQSHSMCLRRSFLAMYSVQKNPTYRS